MISATETNPGAPKGTTNPHQEVAMKATTITPRDVEIAEETAASFLAMSINARDRGEHERALALIKRSARWGHIAKTRQERVGRADRCAAGLL